MLSILRYRYVSTARAAFMEGDEPYHGSWCSLSEFCWPAALRVSKDLPDAAIAHNSRDAMARCLLVNIAQTRFMKSSNLKKSRDGRDQRDKTCAGFSGTAGASGSKRNGIRLPSLRRLDQRFFIKCDTVVDLLRSGNAMVAVPPPPKRSSLSPVPDDPPELNAALTESAVELTESAVEMPLPSNPQTFFLG
ncbi:MAG: hypothetical protein ACXVJ0_17565, partial [Candidatus Angelobacter sp.]